MHYVPAAYIPALRRTSALRLHMDTINASSSQMLNVFCQGNVKAEDMGVFFCQEKGGILRHVYGIGSTRHSLIRHVDGTVRERVCFRIPGNGNEKLIVNGQPLVVRPQFAQPSILGGL